MKLAHQALSPVLRSNSFGLSLVQVLGFAVLTAVSSKFQIYLSFSPVPITLQTAVVMLAGMSLGAKKGALSQVCLIGLALAGLPVFAKALPGYVVLAGPTGGYILGFVLTAWISGAVFERKKNAPFWYQFILLLVASLYIFLPGALWLGMYVGFDASRLLWMGVIPFLPGAVAKCALALLVYKIIKR